MASFSRVRIFLYVILWMFAAVLLALAAVRIHYTTHLEHSDPLNNGRPFYDPIIAELLASSILALLWAFFVIHAIWRRRERGFFTSFSFEAIGLLILWLLYIVGAGISTSIWGDLSFCRHFVQCRELTALVAFAWLGWIVLLVLLLFAIAIPAGNNSWSSPMHGYHTDPRHSAFIPQTSQIHGGRIGRA